ncbi:hypothetical protein [Streptomyces cellulosae]|uniref:Secreted protein n=1 Tax=Streptomyces cellulosae TaxID=1968 RepID=A0ABW7YEQ7_STRCE
MPRNRRRITTIATAVAAVTLTAALATACDPDDVDTVGTSLDCVSDADTITDSLKAIHEAGWDAATDPTRTDESIDTIEKNLDAINKDTDDSKDYDKAVLNGDAHPDSGRIDAAADRLTDLCTS